MSSMTSRAMSDLRKEGYTAGIVEKFVRFPPPGHRVDFLGVIDILGVRPPETGVLGVQVTSGSNTMSRVTKALANPHLAAWLGSGNRFEVWSYRKKGPRGKRKLWVRRRELAVLVKTETTTGIRFDPAEQPMEEPLCENQTDLPLN